MSRSPTHLINAPTVADLEAIASLRSPVTIRERCHQLFTLACADQLEHFRCDLTQLEPIANYVIQVMKAEYPQLEIPFHSRWRHFEVGDRSRLDPFEQKLATYSALEQARIKYDLAVMSVLIDAGAGTDWRYVEPGTGEIFQRSEGLAVASFHLFCQGMFSSDVNHPWQVDADGLQQLTKSALMTGFQVSADNPLVGLEGRLELLRSLGQVLRLSPHLFDQESPRPGHLVQYLLHQANASQLPASKVLSAVLAGLSEIWPGRIAIADINLGDVWYHPQLQANLPGGQLIPFHKLSQWLTYSLLEPLQELGIEITDLDQLTGLPEYRNGGLCLDLGLLQAKHPEVKNRCHTPDSTVIVEWRALTVSLLDQIADVIRQQLHLSRTELPLVKILQGGTWAAGRQIAAELRPEGIPPIQIASDGTVF
ncbi:MAG: URC4/urg3 family protein [Cyanothece sp. SIO1E1]|nr:URC4/urg3 family protein [Cyanothece sp. SIO1E1]